MLASVGASDYRRSERAWTHNRTGRHPWRTWHEGLRRWNARTPTCAARRPGSTLPRTSPSQLPPRSRRHHSRGDGFVVAAVRQLTDRDFDTVDRIQRSAYSPDFLEDLAVFADKFTRYPDGCWVAEVDGQVVGYLFSHPGHFSAPPRPEQAAGRSGGSAGLLLHPRCRGASREARHRRGTAPCRGGARPCGDAWLSWHRVGSRPELAWVLGA